jgi:hypothetical protein
MARIDKTESAVGVVRAALAADVVEADFGKIFGVGLNASGRVVKGAGTTGVIGVINPDRLTRKAGKIIDIFKLGDFVECEGLVAGTKYYAAAADGVISTTNTGTYVGFTVEADRLVLAI